MRQRQGQKTFHGQGQKHAFRKNQQKPKTKNQKPRKQPANLHNPVHPKLREKQAKQTINTPEPPEDQGKKLKTDLKMKGKHDLGTPGIKERKGKKNRSENALSRKEAKASSQEASTIKKAGRVPRAIGTAHLHCRASNPCIFSIAI